MECYASQSVVKAKSSSECARCGYLGVTAGVTRVRYECESIIACVMCDESLEHEVDEPEEDPNAIRTIRVVLTKLRVAKSDSWFLYDARLDIGVELEKWMPPGVERIFSIVGPIGKFEAGAIVLASGLFGHHPKFGLQFQICSSAQPSIQESEDGLIAFLSAFPQVGRTRARLLLTKLGGMQGVLEALDSNDGYMKLTVVSGITEERGLDIKKVYDEQVQYREFRLFASKLGMTEAMIVSAIDAWGKDAFEWIQEDPFILMELPRVSFKKVDDIANKMGYCAKSSQRCAAAVVHVIELAQNEGHAFVWEQDLKGTNDGDLSSVSPSRIRIRPHLKTFAEMKRTGLTTDEIEVGLQHLEQERRRVRRDGRIVFIPSKIIRHPDGRIYNRELDSAECIIAEDIARIMSANIKTIEASPVVWGDKTPAPEQEEFLRLACSKPLVIITGSPGTGKTQSINAVLNTFEALGMLVTCCAPTGKAAMRMKELTGRKAATVHRLLAFSETSSDSLAFDTDVVVLDEGSMLELSIAAKFFNAIRTGTRVVLVGDVDQLPSIGPGRVLADLIESKKVPTVCLTKIFRQESDGASKRIPEVARDINEGRVPNLLCKGTDVNFLECESPQEIQELVVRLLTEILPKKYDFKPSEIQVISPQKGEEGKANAPIGAIALNKALQAKLNALGGISIRINDYDLQVGDRVIHCKNNYDLLTMNGEQGSIVRLSEHSFIPELEVITSSRTDRAKKGGLKKREEGVVLVVDFADKLVGYSKFEAFELQLAYCLTAHRMQGSSARAVVMPIHSAHQFMLTRALGYVGTSRAEEYVLFIGQTTAFAKMVRNTRGTHRNSYLQERLADAVYLDEGDFVGETTDAYEPRL